MIVSHTHKYLFIEVPQTASTAISKELQECYDGEVLLHKHARLTEFEKLGFDKQEYYIFRGIRNPLDQEVSRFLKYKFNHKGNYTNPQKLAKNGGWITSEKIKHFNFIKENDADFETYFMQFHRYPYFCPFDWSKHDIDFVVRYENLQGDFRVLLRNLELKQLRPLPTVNKTEGKEKPFYEYYTPNTHRRASAVFGPHIRKWGYDFPQDWTCTTIPRRSFILFNVLDLLGCFMSRRLHWSPSRSLLRARINTLIKQTLSLNH